MNPEEQRIAIAKHVGYRNIRSHRLGRSGKQSDVIKGVHPNTSLLIEVPDYLNDLNAMQGAWECLGWEERNECVAHLKAIVKEADCEAYFATAAQRAKAFLKTLNT